MLHFVESKALKQEHPIQAVVILKFKTGENNEAEQVSKAVFSVICVLLKIEIIDDFYGK